MYRSSVPRRGSVQGLFTLTVALAFWLPLRTIADPTLAPAHSASEERVVLPNPLPDPMEPFNRVVWAFNEGLMTGLVKPTAKVYRFVVRKPVRQSKSSLSFF